MKYVKERDNLPSEDNDLSEVYGLYLILFFVIFSVVMIGLYCLIICYGFYQSLKAPSRNVYRTPTCQMEEV